MRTTIHAVYDGQVLRPEEPLALRPNTRVVLTITTEERPQRRVTLDELLAGITDQNVHPEVNTGPTVGREAW
jgi:hypothetical protein